jgi:AcrR family transcriptional regulator
VRAHEPEDGPSAVTGAHQPRRSEQKAQTRQALVDAALRLVAEQGFDAVTTEEIAAAAGVSPRTFFRYFATKESVLLFGEDDFVTSFAGVYLAQPPDLSEVDAIVASFVALAPGVARLRGRIALYHRALASSPLLRGQEQRHRDANAQRIALALGRRRGDRRPDAGCSLLAAVTLTTLQGAIDDWVAGPARAELGALVRERFALLVARLSG